MRPDHLLMWLKIEAKVLLSEVQVSDCAEFTMMEHSAILRGYPEWLGFPDILYDPDSSEFLGLVFPVASSRAEVQEHCAALDREFVKLRDYSCAESRNLYIGEPNEIWLEVKWRQAAELEYQPAQLAEIHFYFDEVNGVRSEIVGFELFRLGEILADYHLVLPNFSDFPVVAVESVKRHKN